MPRVLVVDDNEQNRYLLRSLLQWHGYEVEEATNGRVALQRGREAPPNVVISDLLLPGMDGFELCREWVSDEKLGRIPFVVYTATFTEPEDERLALGLGAACFLTKPLEPEVFILNIEEILVSCSRIPNSGKLLEDREFHREHKKRVGEKLAEMEQQLLEAHQRRSRAERRYQTILAISNDAVVSARRTGASPCGAKEDVGS